MNRTELEKRLKTRHPSTLYVSVFNDIDRLFFGLLADLSSSGFKLCSDFKINTGQEYQLAIRNPFAGKNGEFIPFSVKAIWCNKSSDGLYEAGFNFFSYTDEAETFLNRLANDFETTARTMNRLEKETEL